MSADGKWLYFSADAAESRGGLDLYRIQILPDGTFGRPETLGTSVNTERHDGFPVASPDGKLYFASQGHLGLGGFDIFETYELPTAPGPPPSTSASRSTAKTTTPAGSQSAPARPTSPAIARAATTISTT